jgi:hypothetical protein
LLNNNSGIYEHDYSVLSLNPDYFLIWNCNFINFLLLKRQSLLLDYKSKFKKLDFVSMSNFRFIHPIVDYLIFMPTKMAFEKEIEITDFLMDLSQKLERVSFLSDNVYFKDHQGRVNNYFFSNSKIFNVLISIFSFLTLKSLFFLSRLIKVDSFIRFLNAAIFCKLKSQYKLKNLLYPLLPIELYLNLNSIKLIGSFSNTLITSSFFECDFEPIGQLDVKTRFMKRNINVDSSIYLKLNMSFFLDDSGKYVFNRSAFFKDPSLDIPILNLNNI